MTSTDTFTPERPFTTTLTDSRGDDWYFEYRGRANIRIKPDGTDPGEWTNQIDLGNYDPRPEITTEWLDNRAAEWISDRNDDIKKGNV